MPSVRAQYPDSGGPPGQPPVVSSLGSLMHLTRQIDRDPNAAARLRASEREIGREATRALLTTAGIDPRQSGSIVLLMAAIGVLSVGGVLRWHRGRANL